jgi:COP9 signalosome complex subunit 1
LVRPPAQAHRVLSVYIPRKYKSAAKQFLEANLDYCDCPDLMSPQNVAVYGGLTALATFDRTELFKLVISSSQFKVRHFSFSF